MAVAVAVSVAVSVAMTGHRVTRAQRGAVVLPLVRDDRPLVAGQLGVLRLQLLALLPLPAQLRDVLRVAVVGAAPGLGHLLLRQPRPGLAEQARPGRDLVRGAAARRAARCRRVDALDPLEALPAVAPVDVDRHRYQFSMDLVKMAAMSSSVGVLGQVASRRCCFIVPGTSSGTSASV